MKEVQSLAVKMARAVLEEGLDADGGLLYEGRDGRIINPNREWWPQAEAVVGFYNAWQLTGDAAFREAAVRCWRFIKDRIVDHEHGEWFWCVRPDGTPDPAQPKVSAWKGPYHNGRCCLEIIQSIDDRTIWLRVGPSSGSDAIVNSKSQVADPKGIRDDARSVQRTIATVVRGI